MVSICIIVKNEEQNLKKCLDQVSKLGYEIIVVDTGSTDNSKNIAKSYTDEVHDFSWCDDFSAARNYAIKKAKHSYILMVDSDEYLTDYNKEELEKRIVAHPYEVGRIHRENVFTRAGMEYCSKELVNRLFPKNLFYYQGKIHEQIVSVKENEYKTYEVPLTFEHSGYSGDEESRKKKADRNIQLLLTMLKEEGEDPYILYQLGKGYYMDQNYPEAVTYFGKALEFDLDIKLEYVIDMVEMYGYSLINSEQIEQALFLENIYNEFSHSADFVYLMGIVYMNNGLFEKAISEFLKVCNYKECKVIGVNSYLPLYNIGVIYECLGMKDKAMNYYSKCKRFEPAREAMKRCR